MNDWKTRLNEKKILIADGAWGTELTRRGMAAGETPERWNLDRPDDVRAIAAAYVEAGADIVLTNTFGGSPLKLKKAGLEAQTADINRVAVKLSKQAAGDKALVFASIGPTGEFMEPLGVFSESDMVACFAAQVKAFVAGGADAIVIETMTDLNEAKAALKAVKDNSDLSVVTCMTFDKGVKGFATMMGVTPEQAATELTAAGADIIGSNCGSGIVNMIEVAKLLRPATTLPLWIKSNAGLPELVKGQTIFRETPQEMAAHVPALIAAGANIIGGCCGTTPEHIRLIVAAARG